MNDATDPLETDLLQTLIRIAGQFAQDCLIEEGHRELVPSWLLVRGDDKIEIIGTPWKDDRQKREQAARIKKRLQETRAKAYSLVCEAWVAEYPTEALKTGYVRPADRPDRQEFVIVTAASRTQSMFGRWRIVRATDCPKQITELVRDDIPSSWGQPEGWLAHMLD
jgi:hypothetical protein